MFEFLNASPGDERGCEGGATFVGEKVCGDEVDGTCDSPFFKDIVAIGYFVEFAISF